MHLTEDHNDGYEEILRSLEDEKETEHQRYDRRIQELNDEIARVKLKRARAHNARQPVILLPDEIALVIFRHCSLIWYTERKSTQISNTADDDDDNRGQDWDVISRPLSPHIQDTNSPSEIVISHVCHTWRSLALTSPEMWSEFTCNAYRGMSQVKSANDSTQWLAAYLERSQSYPLDLALWEASGKTSSSLTDAIDLIPPHTHRLRQLSIRLSRHAAHVPALTSMEPIRADNLEKLEIVVNTYRGPEISSRRSPSPSQANFQSSIYKDACATKLTALRVPGDLLKFCLPTASSITILQIDKGKGLMSWPTFVAVFQIPTLISLSVSYFLDEPEEITQPIVANNLRHLRCTSFGILRYVLTALIAPCLELMNLSKIDFDDGPDELNIVPSVDENGVPPSSSQVLDYLPAVKILAFNQCTYSGPSPIWRLLARVTMTTTQILVATNSIPDWQPSMLVDNDDTVFWPNLTSLSHSIKLPNWHNGSFIGASIGTGFELLKLLKRHTIYFSSQQFSHQIEEGYLQDLKDQFGPDVWEALEKGGIVNTVVPVNTQKAMHWIPWPPRQQAEFHKSSELPYGSTPAAIPSLRPHSSWGPIPPIPWDSDSSD